MRIRKRSQSVAPVTLPPQLPISCKYQQAPGLLMRPEYSRGAEVVPECSNMQEPCRLDALKDHDSPQSSSDGAAPVRLQSCVRVKYSMSLNSWSVSALGWSRLHLHMTVAGSSRCSFLQRISLHAWRERFWRGLVVWVVKVAQWLPS